MNATNPHLSRRDAERLLDDPAATNSVLATSLAAAKAPARPAELRREDAAVAAFHAARLTPSPTSRRNFVSPSKLGSRAASRAVIATGAIVALTSGGIALASSSYLPTLPDQASDQATASVAKTPEPTEATETEETEAEETEALEVTETAEAEETETESATPTPSFEGLCKAFQATDHSTHGASLDSAAFTALATEAGGAEQVATYCVTLIGEPKETGRPTTLPTPTSKPTPAGRPTTLPTQAGKPTDKPAPAGKPTDKPAAAGKGSSTSGS